MGEDTPKQVVECTSGIMATPALLDKIGPYPPDTLVRCIRVGGHEGMHQTIVANVDKAGVTRVTWEGS